MNSLLHRNIHVFYASPESSGEITAGKQTNETISIHDIEKFSKTLVENFLNTKNKQEANQYLIHVIENIKRLTPALAKECQQKVDIMRAWTNGKSIFDEKGNKKDISANDVIKEIKTSLGIRETGKKIETKDTKAVEEFKKNNPIEDYKKGLLAYCIKHPIQAEYTSYLDDKKKKIDSLAQGQPTNVLKEYSVVIETLMGIVKTDEFGKYTGFISKGVRKVEGEYENISKYVSALDKTLNTAIRTKSVMPGNDLIGRVEAQDKVNEKAAIEAEKKLREKINPTTLYAIFSKEGTTQGEIISKINILQNEVNSFTKNEDYRQRIPKMMDVWNIMGTARKASENEIFAPANIEDFKRLWHGTTKDNFLIALRTAFDERKDAIIAFGDKNGTGESQFSSYSRKDIENMMKNPEEMNINIWVEICKTNNWQTSIIQFAGGGNLWAIGEYVRHKPHSQLLTKIPTKIQQKVKEFLVGQADNHSIDTQLGTLHQNYNEKLFEKVLKARPEIKGILNVGDFNENFKNGAIQGKLLSKMNYSNPKGYIDLTNAIIQASSDIYNENTKTIAETEKKIQESNIKTVDDFLKTIKLTQSLNPAIQKFINKKISSLDRKEATLIIDLLDEANSKGFNELQQTIIKNIDAKITKDIATKTITSTKIAKKVIEQDGMNGISKIKEGKLDNLFIKSADAGAAKQATIDQIEYIKKDEDILLLLKKYNININNLSNPVKTIEIYNKIKGMSDSNDKSQILSYILSIKENQSIEIRNYDTIIKEVGAKDAVSYVSSISGKKESTKSIEAYQFISKNIIPNVEYERNNLTESISRMNIGEIKTLSAFNRSTEDFAASSFSNNYSISLAAPNSYEIRSNSGVIVENSLDVEQASELINDMSVFAETGLDDLIPYIPYLKKRGSQNGMNIGLDGESSTKEQTMMLRKIYSMIFGENIETSNIFDVIRAFKSRTREYSNIKDGMRIHLKEAGFIHEDNSPISQDTMRDIIDRIVT